MGTHQEQKLSKMVNEAINLINKSLMLALVDDIPSDSGLQAHQIPVNKDWSSKRLVYIRQLRIVQ